VNEGILTDYFGSAAYTELRELARDAATRSVRGGPRVLVLPGIMGSTLGRQVLGLDQILWMNPVDIGSGRLTELKLTDATKYHAVGVILLAYLKLKLKLKIAGFDAAFHPFDWRLGLDALGEQLADAIQNDPAREVSIVAHSMGGLVARAALSRASAKVKQLIMLGTPNYGSFAPVQVLRAVYDVVLKVAALDLRHTAEELASTVFNSFPGLYQMLPAPEKLGAIDLYDPAAWPAHGPRPVPALLAGVKPVLKRLAPADSRFFLIAGVNQDTVTGLQRSGDEFTYEVSGSGDGTVPLAFARLADIPDSHTYYVEESHGSLPNNGTVERAIQDLLASGATNALSTTPPPARRATRVVPERELRTMAAAAIVPGQLGASDLRSILDAVAAPPDRAADAAVGATMAARVDTAGQPPTAAVSPEFRGLVIGRRRQQRLELTIAHGSITDVQSRAYVLGIFKNVAPSGAANAVDLQLDGAISEFTARRMFSGDVGEVFTIPMGRNNVRADVVMLAGLGPFDRFNPDVQQLVAENVIRTLVQCHLDEFATVLIGAGTGQGTLPIVQNLLTGFRRGLRDADKKQRFRGVTLCETDASRFVEMKDAVLRLASTSLFEDTEVVLDEIELPTLSRTAAPGTPSPQRGPDPIYLMMRQERPTGAQLQFRGSVLGSGMKAAVVTAVQDVPSERLKTILERFDRAVSPGAAADAIDKAGQEIASVMLPPEIATALKQQRDRHLVVVHDAPSSRIPWETIAIDDWRPSIEAGLSRRYLADNLPLASWLEQRRIDQTLRILLVVNPTLDLDGADREGDRLLRLAQSIPSVEVAEYRHEKATKPAILSALRSGAFDVLHYAGHAFFDAEAPGRSGLLCAGRQVLGGADLAGISNLPCLVFFNACEAGRIRGRRAAPPTPATTRVRESYGVAEALMRGGVANYMSTYWPVGDAAAATFADTFYKSALSGKTIGSALLGARQAVRAGGSRDWQDYILYGDSDFVLKSRAS